jgi:hypothetical protein
VAATNPEVDALTRKLKVYTALGSVLGLGVGFAIATTAYKVVESHGSYVSALFPPSPADI